MSRYIADRIREIAAKNNDGRPLVIFLGGNIGAGKSTIISELKEFKKIEEKIDLWRNVDGFDLFGAYLKNPKKYASIFQYIALLTKEIGLIEQMDNKSEPIIVERSPIDDTLVFAQLLHDEGNISDEEFKTHKTIMTEFMNILSKKMNLIYVYVYTPPDICFERMIKRNRPGEVESYTIDFFKKLDELYRHVVASTPFTKYVLSGEIEFPQGETSSLQ